MRTQNHPSPLILESCWRLFFPFFFSSLFYTTACFIFITHSFAIKTSTLDLIITLQLRASDLCNDDNMARTRKSSQKKPTAGHQPNPTQVCFSCIRAVHQPPPYSVSQTPRACTASALCEYGPCGIYWVLFLFHDIKNQFTITRHTEHAN